MAVDKTLVSGSMAMLLLKLLSEKDMYGYEMFHLKVNETANGGRRRPQSALPWFLYCPGLML